MIPLVLDVVLGLSIVGVLTFTLYVHHRTAPGQLLKAFENVRKLLTQHRGEISEVQEQMLALRGSWRVQSEEIEKYLDSIDSRARRVSAQNSNARKRAAENGPEQELDQEGQLAALRGRAGL